MQGGIDIGTWTDRLRRRFYQTRRLPYNNRSGGAMHTRRQFIGGVAGAAAWAAVPGKDEISLAAWSINRSFFVSHRWTNLELPKICRETFGIGALEFVNQF